jgi:hypothetical protein
MSAHFSPSNDAEQYVSSEHLQELFSRVFAFASKIENSHRDFPLPPRREVCHKSAPP